MPQFPTHPCIVAYASHVRPALDGEKGIQGRLTAEALDKALRLQGVNRSVEESGRNLLLPSRHVSFLEVLHL